VKRISFDTFLTITLVALAGCGGGSDKPPPRKPTTEQGMFDSLGIDTKATPRTYTDRQGTPRTLGEGYNPLGRGVRTLQRIPEIYLAGRGIGGNFTRQMLLDDLKNKPIMAPLPPTPMTLSDPMDGWVENDLTASLAADLDGDGIEEVVNVYFVKTTMELHANVVRCTTGCTGNGGTFTNVKDSRLTIQDATAVPPSRPWFKHGLTAADVDGDGKQELVVANFGGLHVCKASTADFSFTCASRVPNPSNRMSVASGRFDDDPQRTNDAVVVAFASATGAVASVAVYDGTPDAFGANSFTGPDREPTQLSILFADQTAVWTYSEAYVAAGDFDLDGRDEIVLAGRRAGTDNHDLILMDDRLTSFRTYKAFRWYLGQDGTNSDNPDNNRFRAALEVFTKTTKPGLEKAIYAGADVYEGFAAKLLPSSATTLPSGTDITNGITRTFMGYYENGGGNWNHAPNDVVIGDLDGTGNATIVAMWDQVNADNGNQSAFTSASLAKRTWDPGTNSWPTRWTNFVTTTSGSTVADCNPDCALGKGLALVNVDRDSPMVKYRNEHELLFGTPRVLAVLAAPPFYKGVNDAGSETSISFGKGSGFESDSTIGVSTGFSIGYESPDLFGLPQISWKLSFGFAMDWTSSSRVEMTQTETWSTSTEDAVVFTVVPFDVYYYDIVSSPTAAEVGKKVSINVPRKLSTYKVPVALYNDSILDGPKIDATILTHTVGDPTTYPVGNACNQAPPGGTFNQTAFLVDAGAWCFASAQALQVGVGSGAVGFEIARTMSSARGTSTDMSVDFEMELKAGGVSAGVSVGFHWGYGYSVDTSESYSFAGQVADLPDINRGYKFGLMAHRGLIAGKTDYPVFVVDYWVEP